MRLLTAASLFVLLLPAVAQPAPSASSKSSSRSKAPDPGSVIDGIYRSAWFGFSYRIPPGWVERTEQMRDDSIEPTKSLALLAVFARPPEVAEAGTNPGVVVVAESASSYPGVKLAADYLGAITQVTTAKGFEVVNEPYEFTVGTAKLARVDYRKQKGKNTVLQTTLALNTKGYFVSFTFIANDDEIDDLVAGLQFASMSARPSLQK